MKEELRLSALLLLPTLGSLLSCASPASPGPVGSSAPREERDIQQELRAGLEELRSQAKYPGVTAAVALPDGRVLEAAAGWADEDGHVPLKTSDRMLAGSVGKTFVAAALLQAVDEGALDLDAKIERWIGDEPWFERIPNARDLTLRLLLNHRSGLPDHTDSAAFARALRTNLDKTWTPVELMSFIFDAAPIFPAGQQFSYADTNYVLAGLVFEAATGRGLFSEIDRRILKPFGLDHTVTSESRSLEDVVPGLLDPHSPLKITGVSVRNGRLVYDAQAEYAGGGIISTSGDLARWAKLLWEGQVFSRRQLDEMLAGKPAEEDAEYGFATAIVSTNAGPAYLHDGWIPGYQTVILYLPSRGVAGALQVNSDPLRRFKMEPAECLGRVLSLVLKPRD